MGDDFGYGDFGCYGATRINTPHVDRPAREGIRFTDAHSPSSMCTPTRYAFLTGECAWRRRGGAEVLSGVAPLSIEPDRAATPPMLRCAGYATAVVGKWHPGLGAGPTDYNRPIQPGPLEAGFDYAFIIPTTGDRVPCAYLENHNVVGYDPADPIVVDYGIQCGDPLTLRVVVLLRERWSRWRDGARGNRRCDSEPIRCSTEHRSTTSLLSQPEYRAEPSRRYRGRPVCR